MLIQKSRKYRLEPTADQESLLLQTAGCVRFVWNRALAIQKSYLENNCGILSYVDMAKCLTSWRNSDAFGFLSNTVAQPQQVALKHLDRALQDAFNKSNPKQFPKFKKKGQHDSIHYPAPDHLKFDLNPTDGNGRNVLPKIYLPRIGWIKFRKSCIIGGEIRNATVTKSGGHWYVSIQIEKEISDPFHPSNSMVGCDLGVVNLLTLSDGTVFTPVSAYRDMQIKLAKEQRKLSKKSKFSANWKKQKAKISKLHTKIANIRRDALHQISTTISKNHAVVVIEDLKVINMTASHGTKRKSSLNKSILDQGWGLIKQMIGYKLQWMGGMFIVVDPAYTSQTCSNCGVIDKRNRKTQAKFCCVHCGHTENADFNAAKNILSKGILTAGHAGLVCSPI